MPNHCTNNLTCTSGKNIGELVKPYLTDDGKSIDFNKIVPMPEGIEKTTHFSSMEEISRQRSKEESDARDEQLKVLQEENQKLYGYKDWYEWSYENWGTKWNAYNCWTLEDDSFNDVQDFGDISFQTAWSPPLPVIRELAKLTGESLRMTYVDEGYMFAGEYMVGPDGEVDNCYDDMDDIPESSPLWEECDLGNYYENFVDEEDEEEED